MSHIRIVSLPQPMTWGPNALELKYFIIGSQSLCLPTPIWGDFWIENYLTTVTANALSFVKLKSTLKREWEFALCLNQSTLKHFISHLLPIPKLNFTPSLPPLVWYNLMCGNCFCIFWKRKFHIVKRRNAADVVQLKWFSWV